MYANNRAARAPAAVFRTAGGSIYTFSHPFLTGQLGSGRSDNTVTDKSNTADITRSLRLNDTFFNAQPAQANAFQEVMVDGSTLTITNHIMAGTATLQVIPGTGLVRDGDLTAIAPLIVSSKDSVGGVLMRRRFTSGGTLVRVYYGVSFSNFPHDIDMGNGAPVYAMSMLYGGWFEGIMTGKAAARAVWAVGNKYGVEGNFVPFVIQGIGDVSLATEQGNFGSNDLTLAQNNSLPDITGLATKDEDLTAMPGLDTKETNKVIGGATAFPIV